MSTKDILSREEYKTIINKLESNNLTVAYLTLGGSHAYGTNTETSDIDVRGFFTMPNHLRLGLKEPIEDFEDVDTDTVLYSFHKFCKLLMQVNPNVIEMLGTREEDVIFATPIAKKLRNNASLFLSKRAFATFSGYATQQLRRLENALARDSYPQKEKEKHILKSFEAEMLVANKDFTSFDLQNDVRLYLDKSTKEGFEEEIFINIKLNHVPLRDYLAINNNMNTMLRNYGKLRHRNHKKDDLHLRKHAMHLIRLYFMGIDILEKGIIKTYRDEEHDLLMAIRHGDVSFEEVFKLQRELEAKMKKIYETSSLPKDPRFEEINKFVIETTTEFC